MRVPAHCPLDHRNAPASVLPVHGIPVHPVTREAMRQNASARNTALARAQLHRNRLVADFGSRVAHGLGEYPIVRRRRWLAGTVWAAEHPERGVSTERAHGSLPAR